jgi:hypothetical protein
MKLLKNGKSFLGATFKLVSSPQGHERRRFTWATAAATAGTARGRLASVQDMKNAPSAGGANNEKDDEVLHDLCLVH